MSSPPKTRIALLIRKFDSRLNSIIGTDLPILKKIKKHVIQSGGKRIRPLTHYYFCQMLEYPGSDWQDVGAIGELIHTASLLHDDVIDEASTRRGQETVNALQGNKTAVLAGDYLLACGLDHLRSLKHADALIGIFTRVLKMLSVGELLQMQWEHDFKISDKVYNEIINNKTGSLFGAMTECALVLSQNGGDVKKQNQYRNFGERMGRLFQVRDDYLDYFISSQKSGKDPYQDFKRGLVTKPVILMRDRLKGRARKKLEALWQNPDLRQSSSGLSELQELLEISMVKKLMEAEIEEEIHQLMYFLRQHPAGEAQDLMIEQLAKLQIN